MDLNTIAYIKFQVGNNLYVKIRQRALYSEIRDPLVAEWQGSGAMYDLASQFQVIEWAQGYKLSGRTNWVTEAIIIDGREYYVAAYREEDVSDAATDIRWDSLGNRVKSYYNPFQVLVVPSGITSIASRMFYNWYLEGLSLPNSITEIGTYAFFGSFNYTGSVTITIPSGIRIVANHAYIGGYSFANGKAISKIDFSNNNNITKDNLYTTCFQTSGLVSTIIVLGNQSLREFDWRSIGRAATFDNPPEYLYKCYDSVNGEQSFRLYDSPQGSYNRVFQTTVNGQVKNLYLPMVDMNDTVNGGNRVQYISGVGSKRFKK